MPMHMYYWEDPGNCGYDYVALADHEENARSKAINAYDGPPELRERVIEGLQRRPTGIFHYNSAIEIFTECDPEGSLASHIEWEAARAALASYKTRAVCGHMQNFQVGDDWGNFACTLCTIDQLKAKLEARTNG